MDDKQWGFVSGVKNGKTDYTVTLPMSVTNVGYMAIWTPKLSYGSHYANNPCVKQITKANFTYSSENDGQFEGVRWLSIGQ